MITHLRTTRQKARRRYGCNSCWEQIDAGEQYEYSVSVADGTAYPWREHEECHKEVTRLWGADFFSLDDGSPEGALVDYCTPEELSGEWRAWFASRFGGGG